ncbi:MAG: hypothetical protein ACO1NQ_07085 [Flavobacteriales bacterium]
MRRSLVVLLLLAVCGATAWTLYRWNSRTEEGADPWGAFPDRAGVIIVVPDAWVTSDRFTHTSQHWSTLEHMPTMSAIGRLMAQTSARAENDEALRAAITEVTVLVALMRTGNEQVDVLLAFAPRAVDGVPLRTFTELLRIDEAALGTLQAGGTVQCTPDSALKSLSVATRAGVWLVASSPAMMDEALLHAKSGTDIAADPRVKEALNTLGGGADAHVLVHLERAKNLLHTWWRPNVIDAQQTPTGWVALDVSARPDAILLSGLILPDTAHLVLSAINQQGTGRNDLGRWLPREVSAWDVRQVSDGEAFLRANGTSNDSAITTLGPNLFNWVNGSTGLAYSSDTTANGTRCWALFETGDPEGAAAELRRLCPDGVNCDTLEHRGIRMTRMPVAHAYERLLGEGYAVFEQPWWSVLGDVIVVAPRPEVLRSAIDAWHDGRTLAEDERTIGWTERIASTAGRTLRWDIARHWPHFAKHMKPAAAAMYTREQAAWQRFGGLAIQLTPALHGRTHITIGLEHAPVEARSNGIHWSTPLPPGATRRPDILLNHTNGTREVLVQDGDHRIHLIGPSGKPLWHHDLDGPILGEVHQVDRFKNGKLQLLFNTADRIHLIDRNGKDVGGFPIELPAKASAPIAVFDYEGTKEYRLVLGLADGTIVNYGMDGAATTGWALPRLGGASTNAVHHLRIQNKDYLLAFDGNGPVKVYDRRGSERERTDLDLGKAAAVLAVSPGLEWSSTRVIWRDTTGVIQEAALNGTPRTLSGPGVNLLGERADDGMYDIIQVKRDSLLVRHNGKEVWTRSFGTALHPGADPIRLPTGLVYGVRSPEREEIMLVDGAGRPMDGLPVRGSTAFRIADLDLDGTLELVTVLSDGHVVAYNVLAESAK